MTNQNIAPEGKRWVVIVEGNYHADYDDKRLAMRDKEYLNEEGYLVEIKLMDKEW
jgi:hypothetical protein